MNKHKTAPAVTISAGVLLCFGIRVDHAFYACMLFDIVRVLFFPNLGHILGQLAFFFSVFVDELNS